MENTEIIVVKQLPVIEEQLRTVQQTIRERVEVVLAMECTEETVRAVKEARAELNREFKALETRRKEVKAKIEAPYKAFEAVYKTCAGDIYAAADRQLAEKIRSVEDGLRHQKEKTVRAYFVEYRQSLGIPEDLADYWKSGINVTLSASEKSLKAQAKSFLDQIRDDLIVMENHPNRDEVLAEYRSCRNVARAIASVMARHEQIEAERKRREADMAVMHRMQEHSKEVEESSAEMEQLSIPEPAEASEDEFYAPVTEPAQDENCVPAPAAEAERVTEAVTENASRFSVAFKVTGTLEQLKAMKKFLIDGGYEYEQL